MVSSFLQHTNNSLAGRVALQAIDDAGLQAPPLDHLARIIRFAVRATDMLFTTALVGPTDEELNEFFKYCVIAAVNHGLGVGDAAAV